ncbi:ATP synthase subunit I [Nocardioides cheoyonin]|uniref:ATP synthase subunit I n=1 Tax=Nocardioides cheoyonin TaxID=3156615 RepID=UPI0032B50AD4
MTTTSQAIQQPGRATVGRVIRDQRKIELVALGMMVFSLWFGQSGDWLLPACLAGGVLLGLLNHLATEFWLLRVITSGAKPTRGQMTRATIVRLAVLAVIAVGVAALLWPDGIGLLLGLAIFRLIALVMTTIPLLKELKNP